MTTFSLHPNSSPNLYSLSGLTNACLKKTGVTAHIGKFKRYVAWIANPTEQIWRIYNFAVGSALLATYLTSSEPLPALDYLPSAIAHLHQAVFVHPQSEEEFKRLGIFINGVQLFNTITDPRDQLAQVFSGLTTKNLVIAYSANLVHCYSILKD